MYCICFNFISDTDDDVCPIVELPSTSESATPVKSKRKGKRVIFEDSDSDQSVELKESTSSHSIATNDALDDKAATKAKKIAAANAAISSDFNYGEPTRKDQPIRFEPTVAYDLEENHEDSITAATPITDPTVPYFLEESREEGLKSTAMEGERSDLNDIRGEEPEVVGVAGLLDAGSTQGFTQDFEFGGEDQAGL